MLDGDVADQFEHGDRLADARAAEQADLAAPRHGAHEVDDLHPRLKQFDVAFLVLERRWIPVYGHALAGVDRAFLVDGVAEHVHDAAKGFLADGNGDRLSRVGDREAAREALGGAHRDGANDAVAELLLHLERQSALRDEEGVVDLGNLLPREFDVDDRADDLDDFAAAHALLFPCLLSLPCALRPLD